MRVFYGTLSQGWKVSLSLLGAGGALFVVGAICLCYRLRLQKHGIVDRKTMDPAEADGECQTQSLTLRTALLIAVCRELALMSTPRNARAAVHFDTGVALSMLGDSASAALSLNNFSLLPCLCDAPCVPVISCICASQNWPTER